MIGFKPVIVKIGKKSTYTHISSYCTTRLTGFHIIGVGTTANCHFQACALLYFRALIEVAIVICLKALIFISYLQTLANHASCSL